MGNAAFSTNSWDLMSTWLYQALKRSVNANLRRWNVQTHVDATLSYAKTETFRTKTDFI